MRDEIAALIGWQRAGTPFALATVVSTSSSAPRPAGASMALHPDGRIVGNISGGCVEPAVVDLAERVLASGTPERTRFGFSDDEALAVGLPCGGEVDVLVRRVDEGALPLAPLAEALSADEPVVLVTVISSSRDPELVGASIVVTEHAVHGQLAATELGRAIALEGRAALRAGSVTVLHLGAAGQRMGEEVSVLVESFADRPQLIIFGAIDHAAAIASIGRFLGFRVTVCDARSAFATRERLPDADEVIVAWPHHYLRQTALDTRSAICVLTHDAKFDVPAIVAALATPAGYIGVMGSRRTHEDRLARLRSAGVSEEGLARLRSPIGLALGGRSPQETAISVAAELVMLRNGASGLPLSDTVGPIHPRLG